MTTALYSEKFSIRDYQAEGIAFLEERKRAMLTDAPGLGKTAQATFAAKGNTLVICPSYLVPQWLAWLTSVGIKARSATGMRWEREQVLDDTDYDWLVINHEMLDGYEQFADARWVRRWRTIIIDESHHLKAHQGKRAKAAVKLCLHTEYVFLLTATPIKREIDDLFMQFRILQPDIFTSYWRFVRQFCLTEQTYFGTKIKGAKKSMRRELEQIISLMSLGRSYETAGRELPPIIPKFITVELNKETRKIYDELIDYWRVRDAEGNLTFTNYMEVLHSLRQHLTGALKADVVASLIEDVERQSVAFSWYKNTAMAIKLKLGANCELATGDINQEVRIERAKQAMFDGRDISATISALPEGVDLSRARNLIFAEEDFTPGSNYQALSRVRREREDGHSNAEPIICYYVHCAKTIDVAIHDVSTRRAGTVKDVIKEALYL